MKITEESIKKAVARTLNINTEERMPDWFDVLELLNIIEKQQKEINRLKLGRI